MKIVINTCFGGFGLSEAAENLYLKKKGLEVFRYEQTKWRYKDGEEEYLLVKRGSKKRLNITFVYTENHGTLLTRLPAEGFWYDKNLERNDPILVEVVEELGEKADGAYAKLKVVEIPEGVQWYINDYDGIESINERHQSWS